MRKDKIINLRLTQEAYEQVQKDADDCGLDLSKYVRSRLMNRLSDSVPCSLSQNKSRNLLPQFPF